MRISGNRTIIMMITFVVMTSVFWNQIPQVNAQGFGAALTGNIIDQGVDRDGDGLFEFLGIGVEVNVTEAGDYTVWVTGFLDNDSKREINWGCGQTYSLDVGVQLAYVYFKGKEIYGSGINVTNASIDLSDKDGNSIGTLYRTPLSRKYLYTEFEAPGALLTGVVHDQGVDTDEDGAFNFLEIGVEVNVTEAGYYTVGTRGAQDSYNGYISVEDSQLVSLDVGVQVVYLRLDGPTIYASGLNPTEIFYISLWDNESPIGELHEIPLSREYLCTEFDAPGALLTGVVHDQGVDTDEDGAFNFLEIGVEVNLTEAGNYSVGIGGLRTSDYGYINCYASQLVSLDVGVQVVYLRLDGPTIYASGLNPMNVSYIGLYDEDGKILGELHDTSLSRIYLYTEFDAPGALLTGVIYDRGVDTDEDGTFEYLEIGVEVNVTEAGNYRASVSGLTGSGYGIGIEASESRSLDVGIQVVNISLDGQQIYSSGFNPVSVSKISLNDRYNNLIQELYDIPLSREYFYTEFGAPAPITVGVKIGNWAKYNVTVTWQSTMPGATEPPQIQEMRKIEWLKVEVQGINATIMTILMTYHFKNGTDQTLAPMSGDIATQFLTFIIPSNLSTGDLIAGTAAPINGTTIRNYAGMNRTVNYLGFSTSFFGVNMTQIMYWDKATGILCEMLMEMSTITDSYVTTTSTSIEMIETNVGGKTPSALSCSVSKDTITQGESIVVSGSINATLSGKTVTLIYRKPDGSTMNRTAITGSDGSYSDSYTLDATGSWSVTASWEGDSTYNGAASSSQSIVVSSKSFIETPLGIAMTGGGTIIIVVVAVFLVLRKRQKIPEKKEVLPQPEKTAS